MSETLRRTTSSAESTPVATHDSTGFDDALVKEISGHAAHPGNEKATPPALHQMPKGFWHRDMAQIRLHIAWLWFRITFVLCVFILGILSVFWGSLFNTTKNLEALRVVIVDFDGQVAPYTNTTPLVGPAVVQHAQQIASSSEPHVGFQIRPPSDFNYDPIAVRQFVYDEHAWAAVIVNANATALLQVAVRQANSSYDPAGACQLIFEEARDQNTITYVRSELITFEKDISASFGAAWGARIAQDTTVPRSSLQAVPQAFNPSIAFSVYNLRPFGPAVITPAVSIGLIYLIVIAFFSFSFYLPVHIKFILPHRNHPPLFFHHWIAWRWCATVGAYFFLSFSYSLVSLAFQIPFNHHPAPDVLVVSNPNAYYRASFLVYWMLNFVGMAALGLACENVAMLLGQPWTGLWLVFWIITNVCTGFYDITLAPGFYAWGYAWPLHNIVYASRTILFDTHSKIGLNFGILFAWTAINTTLFPFTCYFMRWKQRMAKEKGEEWAFLHFIR